MVESDGYGMRKGLFEGMFKEMESAKEGKEYTKHWKQQVQRPWGIANLACSGLWKELL